MRLLTRAVNWLNERKPSIGFYIGNNPWDSSEKDAEIERLKHQVGALENTVGFADRRVLSVLMQKEELQRELEEWKQATFNRDTEIRRMEGEIDERRKNHNNLLEQYRLECNAHSANVFATIEKLTAAEDRVKELEDFIKSVRDNYDCDEDNHKYQEGRGCRCCEAEKLLPKGEEDPCEGCQGECSICSLRNEPGSRYQLSQEER